MLVPTDTEFGQKLKDDNSFLRQSEKEGDNLPSVQKDDYYNITHVSKKSPTAIMLEDLKEFVFSGKPPAKVLETQFLVGRFYLLQLL